MTVRLHRDEEGMTLVELLVVVVILGVVGTIALTGIVNGMRTTTRAQDRIDALTELERGVERIAREFRAACQVNKIESDDASVNITRGGDVHRYRYVLGSYLGGGADPDSLYEERSVRDPSTGSFVTQGTRLFIRDLDNADPFAFFDKGGSPESDIAMNVSKVEIVLRRQLPDQDPIEMRTSVHLRNHGGFTCGT